MYKSFKQTLIGSRGWFEASSVTNPLRKGCPQAGARARRFPLQILEEKLDFRLKLGSGIFLFKSSTSTFEESLMAGWSYSDFSVNTSFT